MLFAVKGTDTAPEVPPEAVPIVGACGFAVGTTAADAPDDPDVPIAFVAVTVKVYDDAGAVFNPETTIGDEAPVPVSPPGEDVTVYPVMGSFPLKVGAVKVIEACPAL